MINAVGKDIPEQILGIIGKEVFRDNHYKDGVEFKRVGSNAKPIMNNTESKLTDSIHDALVKCGAHDEMTVNFHYHFKDGDRVVSIVMEEIHKMGLKDITICTSSLGKAYAPLILIIEDGTVIDIELSGVCGAVGEVILQGKLKGLTIIRSHGGRVRAMITGEAHIDIVFIGTSTCDDYGNCRGIGGKADYGILSYSHVDGSHTDKVVAITDCLMSFPNYLTHIPMQGVDHVCVTDETGDPAKVATRAVKPTTGQRKLLVAEYCIQVVTDTPFLKGGLSYQTGVGGASIASTISLTKIIEDRGIKIGLGVGDLTKLTCNLLERGMVRCLLDTQDFDLDAIKNMKSPNHLRISAGACVNPFSKDSFVNKLDYIILATPEVDVNFNRNVVVGSDDVVTRARRGHPDTVAGTRCTIAFTPLLQGRIPAICSGVTTVTTPGESIDIVVTDYGVVVNPRRSDLLEASKAVDYISLKTIQKLRDIVYSIVGELEKVQFVGHVIGIIETRDGTVTDVVRQIKPFEFAEQFKLYLLQKAEWSGFLSDPLHK